MRILWICGLPEDVRCNGSGEALTTVRGAAWSWIVGHLPPPHDVELHIACPVIGMKEDRREFDYRGAHWHCFKQDCYELAFLWFRMYYRIKSFAKELKPDVVHGWGGETGCGWIATWLSNVAVVSVQGLLLMFWHLSQQEGDKKSRVGLRTWIVWMIEKGTYRRAAKLLVESDASRKGLRDYYHCDGELVPHPLREGFASVRLQDREKLMSMPIKIVFLGSLTERKGAVDAIKAFANVCDAKTSLVMIGDGTDKSIIEAIVRERGLEKNVRMLANLSPYEIISEFSDAQFFLLPSYGDTGPTALKEALSCGLYPICYDNSGPRDLIHHYGCGSLVTTGDIVALSNEIEKCVGRVSDCVKIGTKSAQVVRRELSSESVWRKLLSIYTNQDLLSI